LRKSLLDEILFYDALVLYETAKENMKDLSLNVIVQNLKCA